MRAHMHGGPSPLPKYLWSLRACLTAPAAYFCASSSLSLAIKAFFRSCSCRSRSFSFRAISALSASKFASWEAGRGRGGDLEPVPGAGPRAGRQVAPKQPLTSSASTGVGSCASKGSSSSCPASSFSQASSSASPGVGSRLAMVHPTCVAGSEMEVAAGPGGQGAHQERAARRHHASRTPPLKSLCWPPSSRRGARRHAQTGDQYSDTQRCVNQHQRDTEVLCALAAPAAAAGGWRARR